VAFDIFKISNKNELLTFRMQCFPFLIRNVSPCHTTKYIEVAYIWLNFFPCFFWCYNFQILCGSVIYYVICTVDGLCLRLAGQDIFIKFNIYYNNDFIGMRLKNSIDFDIFKISNKNALLTFRMQFFPFLIRNVRPCHTTKYT
jgi:hypothetical protein